MDGAFAFFGFTDFGFWREDAESGVDGDLFHGFDRFRSGIAVGGWLGKVEAGDLEAVEEEAGAAWVDVVGGDALEDLADGDLDGGAVFGKRDVEGGAAAAAPSRVGNWFSSGVMVVAEFFVLQTGAAAATAVGEDVAALEASGRVRFGVDDSVVHMSLPTG